ncbi:MAG: RES family NAD+ phosphorylase [Planctomycetota bacterium]
MIVAWRLVKWSRRDEAFTGEGAKRYPGRWNQRGQRVVYLAESVGLAVLETWVHVEPAQVLLHFALIRVEIPDSLRIRELDKRVLPRNWNRNPPSASTRALGGRWLEQERTPLLRVPSVVAPHATNLLFNPMHPQAVRVKTFPPERFRLDLRLLK